MLAVQDYLSLGEFSFAIGVIIFFMVSSTKFLNNNVTVGFEKRESARLIFAILLVMVALFGFAENYLFMLLVFLALSLVVVLLAPREAGAFSSLK
jgi:F0F1-type ATP synthase assembly protein I